MRSLPLACLAVALCALAPAAAAADKPRARALGIPFDGKPGAGNAITDVTAVTVGYSTVIAGSGKNAVRSGVTAILPRGRESVEAPVFAGVFSLNGNGEMTGTHWIEESGFLEGPVLITGTHSVGVVRDAVIAWRVKQRKPDATGYWWSLPVIAETWDGELSDANGFHIRPEHAFAALESAASGPIAEGNVGGGTAMTCHEFKCGTGTSSRVVEIDGKRYLLGTLVQANYGVRSELRIAGVPVGKFMPVEKKESQDQGSIIVVIATDAPLLPQQLKRLARRASLGLARNGSYSGDGSGDIFIAFSTA
ncbi:MAG: P1 family peptidase, partial [Steroidobacteraceae bacterium]